MLILQCLRSQSLVLPGDYPDPSVVKIGNTFWASATTSNWAPVYPLLESKDLLTWKTKGFVFTELPGWADYYFWAPEINYDNGKVYVYYAAHKRGGNLCVAVASADKPDGKYKDHGPLLCEEAGSIDAFPMRDENGKLYLIWKEDGNSVKKPTPIWAMEMNEDRTRLMGEKKELFRNDVAWEGNLVEGVSMIRRGEYFYAFFSGAGCCGRECTYGIGAARSKNLLGPWEKFSKNPVLTGNDTWKCPGHGTPVEKDGKFYFLYHAYDTKGDVYTGRQGLLTEFKFTEDNWIAFTEQAPAMQPHPTEVKETFGKNTLSTIWQWSVFQKVKYNIHGETLDLYALPENPGAFLGVKITQPDYYADVEVLANQSTAFAGIGLIGDEKNIINLFYKEGKLVIAKLQDGVQSVIREDKINVNQKLILRISVKNGKDITFHYSTDGSNFSKLNQEPLDGYYLPPWDRAVRVALIAKGQPADKAVFKNFVLENTAK